MKQHEKLFNLRKQSGLSQEEVAEKLSVSRQAISRWENGTACPSGAHLLALSQLFSVSADYLLNEAEEPEDRNPAPPEEKKGNPILQTNLILIAIIAQASALNVIVQPVSSDLSSALIFRFRMIEVLLLLAASIWMAANHRYEPDLKQRKKNTRIELGYCMIQSMVALFAYYSGLSFLGTCLLITVCCIYLLKINPQYMNRRLTK